MLLSLVIGSDNLGPRQCKQMSDTALNRSRYNWHCTSLSAEGRRFQILMRVCDIVSEDEVEKAGWGKFQTHCRSIVCTQASSACDPTHLEWRSLRPKARSVPHKKCRSNQWRPMTPDNCLRLGESDSRSMAKRTGRRWREARWSWHCCYSECETAEREQQEKRTNCHRRAVLLWHLRRFLIVALWGCLQNLKAILLRNNHNGDFVSTALGVFPLILLVCNTHNCSEPYLCKRYSITGPIIHLVLQNHIVDFIRVPGWVHS